jgi:glutathione S-transferase
MRARMALFSSGQPCALREVVLRDKPPEMLEASPKGTVPVLVLPDGEVIDESYAIMKWALENNDPDNWLSPKSGTVAEIDALIAENDGDFKHHLDRYKYPNRYDGADAHFHREEGLCFLQKLESRLSEADFLFGPAMTLADAAIAPFVRQFAHTDKDWFDTQDLPEVQRWLEGILGSAVFQTVMKKYSPWQQGDPEPVFAADAQSA